MSRREPAWRVTARELESSLEEERGTGERAASYLLSPFGARMNRVVLAGAISPAEPVGRDDPPTFWRARLTDPTGAIAVTAGSFQPVAMARLRATTEIHPALVVGKVHLFRGRDGVAYISVRAEGVKSVAEADERAMLAEIVRQTLDRLDLVERLEREPGTAEAELVAAGTPAGWIPAARDSLRRYPQVDRAAFRRELGAAVRRVAGDSGPRPSDTGTPPGVVVTRTPPPRPPAPPPTAEQREEEAAFLTLLDELSDVSIDGYADLKELTGRLAAQGVGAERAETVLNRLEEEGAVEEPIVGKLRRA